MKKVLARTAVPVVLMCVAALATACGGAKDDGRDSGEALEVRVMHAAPVEAGTNVWVPAHHEAYEEVADEYDWNVEYAETVPYGQAAQILDRWGREGVDVVFLSDNGFESYMLAAAATYPDTRFVMMSELSTTKDLKNVASYTVDWCDLGYLQGVAAALVSSKHEVGAIGSLEILPVKLALSGLRAGMDAAVPNTGLEVKYTGDFVDVAKHQEAASALMADGADVILGEATLTPPIAVRVQEEGQIFIGTFADESPSAPDATATSIAIEFKKGYETVAQELEAGTFDASIHRLGYADGYLTLLPFADRYASVSDTADGLLAKLKSGEVDLNACRADQGA